MLVDLGRNDLGRVSEYGSVTVDQLMDVETYSHVMHIVSSVSGTPARGRRCDGRAARRCSPPARCRARRRSGRCRSSTSSSRSSAAATAAPSATSATRGDLDTCIHIRTLVVKDGVAHVQAGGGTVADAKPDYEYRESVAKAQAVMRAVALAADRPDWP